MGPRVHRSWGVRIATSIVVASACFSLAGCGDEEPTFGPAAEPAESPPARVEPAGKVVEIGAGAEGIAFDGSSGTIALGLREPYRLAFVDPEKLFITYQVPIPNPVRHLAVSPKGGRVAVPAESANELFVIASGRGILDQVPVGEHPHDAAFAAGSIFTADEFGDTITEVKDGAVVDTLPGPVQPGGIAAVDDRYLAVIAVSERVLQVFDANSGVELGSIPAGVGPTHIEALGDEVFVADTEGDVIRRFRIGTEPEEVESVPAAGTPYGVAIDPRRQRLWVTLTATNQLAGYSLKGPTMKRFATYPTVSQPNSVTVDPDTGDVFVASRTEGQLERISPKGSDG